MSQISAPQSVQQLWSVYWIASLPPSASPLHVEMTRRTFYAGVASLLQLLQARLDPAEYDALHAILFAGVEQELAWFDQEVQEGRA
jgi:hypothetical protein